MPDLDHLKSRLCDVPIVIDAWRKDDTYDGIFSKGARDKSTFFAPEELKEVCLTAGRRYLFKLSRKWCPWQFWVEIIAYRLGLLMGVPVPPVHIGLSRTYTQGQETYGALIEWFYEEKSDLYADGGLFMVHLMEDYDRKKGTQHNFSDIVKLFGEQNLFMEHWAKIFTLDCLIGNTDRHQDNWGIIIKDKRIAPQGEKDILLFSPAFDNGTSMGYEIFEKDFDKYRNKDRKMLENYLRNPRYARHHMKWSLAEPKPLNFYGFMGKFAQSFPKSPSIIRETLDFNRPQVETLLMPLVSAVSDPTYRLTEQRLVFMLDLIFERKALLEKALGL